MWRRSLRIFILNEGRKNNQMARPNKRMITIGGVTAQRTSFRFAYLECDAVSFFPKNGVIFLWDTFNGYDLLEDKIAPTITDSNICAIAPTCPGRSLCSSCPENRKQFEPKTCIDCFQKESSKLYSQRVIETPKVF